MSTRSGTRRIAGETRKWLREIESESDAEISERLFSFREGLAAVTHTKSRSAARFVLVTMMGSLLGSGLWHDWRALQQIVSSSRN